MAKMYKIVEMLIILICVEYSVTRITFGDVTGYKKFPRKKCPGNDLSEHAVSSSSSCGQLCDNLHTCKFFEYSQSHPDGHNNCWIKSLCTPKYGYSNVVYEKITDEGCNFIEEEGYALYGHNDKMFLGSDIASCKKRCYLNIHWCLSMEFNKKTRACFLSSQSRKTAPKYYGPSTNTIYFHLNCGEDVEDYDWLPVEGNEETAASYEIVYEDGQCFMVYGPFGGTGGGAFTDKTHLLSGNISALTFHYTNMQVLRCLGISYGNTQGKCHGGHSSRNSTTVTLETDEYITGFAGSTVNVANFDIVSQLMFKTNKQNIGPYGGDEGGRATPFHVNTQDKHLAYISGTCGALLDTLVLHFHC